MVIVSPVASSPHSEKPKYSGGLLSNAKDKFDVTQLKVEYAINEEDPDEEFGGTQERKSMEKRLIRKLDIR